MRNNQDRLGPDPSKSTNDPAPNNISYINPTEMVDLPTKGLFYPQNHPLHNVEAVEMRYMTTEDEEILNSKSLIQKGVAIDKMIQRLIVNQNVKVDDLFIGDKNALVLAARIMAYGNEYQTNVTCPACSSKSEYSFNLNEIKPKEYSGEVNIDGDGVFQIELPKTKAKVGIRMLLGNDEKTLKMMQEKKQKHKLPETPLQDQLKLMVVSLNGNPDKLEIENFLKALPAFDSKFIRTTYAQSVPNVDFSQEFDCPKCGSSGEVTIPFTAEFFWPK